MYEKRIYGLTLAVARAFMFGIRGCRSNSRTRCCRGGCGSGGCSSGSCCRVPICCGSGAVTKTKMLGLVLVLGFKLRLGVRVLRVVLRHSVSCIRTHLALIITFTTAHSTPH